MTKLILFLAILIYTSLTIGQNWQEVHKELPPPNIGADNQWFGHDVAIDGNYAVIGVPGINNFQGLAYVYFFDGVNWERQATLTASDAANFNRFGKSVAISGDKVVVGADGKAIVGSYSGTAYIFEKPVGGWSDMAETAQLDASDPGPYVYFGQSVAIDDSIVVIGAKGKVQGVSGNAGAVYVFSEPLTGWVNTTETAQLSASDYATDDYLGTDVDISGNVIVAGAYLDDDNGIDAGMVYVFTKPGAVWTSGTQDAKLSASDGATGDELGGSVAIDGDVIVAGAEEDDDNGSGSGSAYVFVKPGATWLTGTETAKLTSSDGTVLDHHGADVQIEGDQIIVGADNDDAVVTGGGSAYIYEKPGGGWTTATETAKFTASDAGTTDFLGWRVAISGTRALVVAKNDDEYGTDAGSVYFYEKPGANWLTVTETSKILAYYESFEASFFGSDVAIDGNYAVIGSRGAANYQGVAHVLFWDGNTWNYLAKLTSSDGVSGDWLGLSVDISGDVIVVGAHYDDDNGNASGSAYVFVKPGGGWVDMNETAKLLPSVGFQEDYFGRDVAISGDVIVIGADGDDVGVGNSGGVFVYEKPGGGWTNMIETCQLAPSDPTAGGLFGYSVDIDGDNIVVGAYGNNINGSDAGAAYVYTKPGLNWVNMTETAKLLASDGVAQDFLGYSVAISGDNVVVGAHQDDPNGSNSGSAYIYTKPGAAWTNMNETAKLTASNGSSSDYFGQAVNIFNDYIIIGSKYVDDPSVQAGSSYFFAKPVGGWVTSTEDLELQPAILTANDNFGNSVAISDQFIVAGAQTDDIAGINQAGSVSFFKICQHTANTINPTACGTYTSPSGNYTWTATGTYMDTIPNTCGSDSVLTINLTINPLDDATFNYTMNNYCTGAGNETPTVTFPGGTFTSTPVGLNINSTSGEIDFSLSTPGLYTVTYLTNGTCPNSSNFIIDYAVIDSDGDGLTDCDESNIYGTDPNDPDTDSDGLSDGIEVLVAGTNPLNADSDNDGLCDGPNSVGGTCLGGEDIDADGVVDAGETDPLNDDTDGDMCGDATDPNPLVYSPDSDGDGFGNDCDICEGDDLTGDNDGDGFCANIDCDDNDPNQFPGQVWYADCDGDGYFSDVPVTNCFMPATSCNDLSAPDGGYTNTFPTNPDCDDENPNLYPGTIWYEDADNDGFGDAGSFVVQCMQPANYVSDNTDCDDNDPNNFPGNPEVCDGFDNNCNSIPDDGVVYVDYYPDMDGDGFGDVGGVVVSTCDGPPANYVADSTDCVDSDNSIYPGATEVPDDGIDQDCNGFDAVTCYEDLDGDGYGSTTVVIAADGSCDAVQNESAVDTDCDDTNNQVNPSMTEFGCNGLDDDCNPASLDVFSIDITTTSSGMLIVANNTTADAYQWIDCANGNQPIAGETGQTFLATGDGEYAVIIYKDDCADTSNCVVISSIGLDEKQTASVSVYPNPARNLIKIVSSTEIENIELLDMQGRVLSVVYNKENQQVDVSTLESGRYILRVQVSGKTSIIHIEVVR
ncbi:MAG: T9SS type A sorting domain-containing protein [Crocinitomicaceae bacterium]|nr:T9SS type A sorting domain-containing protein [Crocinitomicaceae bacterium]